MLSEVPAPEELSSLNLGSSGDMLRSATVALPYSSSTNALYKTSDCMIMELRTSVARKQKSLICVPSMVVKALVIDMSRSCKVIMSGCPVPSKSTLRAGLVSFIPARMLRQSMSSLRLTRMHKFSSAHVKSEKFSRPSRTCACRQPKSSTAKRRPPEARPPGEMVSSSARLFVACDFAMHPRASASTFAEVSRQSKTEAPLGGAIGVPPATLPDATLKPTFPMAAPANRGGERLPTGGAAFSRPHGQKCTLFSS
mmetsp:Transcript_6612/g.20010  ORF Transcript_6612/g.20010 Transcript_6612/m.20010 type:complete len:254 (+) Transcript_6612:1907-2668(+)